MTTLFHEFGHGLHHMLTQIDTAGVSGINGVPWDAVELPSQFMENWCWEPEALAFISGHYQCGEPLPKAMLDKLLAAKITRRRCSSCASWSSACSISACTSNTARKKGADPADAGGSEENGGGGAFAKLGPLPARLQPHLRRRLRGGLLQLPVGGSAVGRRLLALRRRGIFNAETGKSFLDNILSRGGSEEPMALFKRFRGREPQLDAMLRHYGIKG